MKQILQSLKTGVSYLADVPPPTVQKGRVLVSTAASVISAGTEKATVDLGKKSLLGKAKERPDLVRKVIQKVKDEGILETLAAVREKLDEGIALGYSAAGVVAAVGDDVTEFRAGDRVACGGVGYASHAEVLSVPKNLCVRIPDAVDFEAGAFGTIGAIALQGIRLAQPTLGEAFVVIGLGLLGQITVQLLRANGCRVFGVDFDERKLRLAKDFGAEDCAKPDEARDKIAEWSRGRGADAVLIAAAASSNDPIELAGDVSRLKGRVVVVGAVGLEVPRASFFARELSLQISMSYGPGRYDAEYEERGHDYPFSYVRWTEARNIEAFLNLIADGSINLEKLITHRFSIENGADAYRLISGETKEPYLGIVLQYDAAKKQETRIELKKISSRTESSARVGVIGAGGYAKKMLLPNFKANKAEFRSIATASGLTAREIGRQYDFAACVSNGTEVIADEDANLIVIATRHDSHAEFARLALEKNKHVFVEKPLAVNEAQLDAVIAAARRSTGSLTVGFNRRFSPLGKAAKEFFAGRREPLSILYRVNAGRVPRGFWINDADQGGRIIGEVCHFVDFMHFLTGSLTTRVFAEMIAGDNYEIINDDSIFVTLRFADGSNGAIAYLAEGDKAVSKERIEIYGGGKTFVIDDFRQASVFAKGREIVKKLGKQDKGQAEEIRVVCAVAMGAQNAPIALEDLAATTRATFKIRESLRSGTPVEV